MAEEKWLIKNNCWWKFTTNILGIKMADGKGMTEITQEQLLEKMADERGSMKNGWKYGWPKTVDGK